MALICLITRLALSVSGLWHHHEDSDGPHDDCTVCVAAATDKTDGLPPPVIALAPLRVIALREIPIFRSTSVAVPRHCLARGPPAA